MGEGRDGRTLAGRGGDRVGRRREKGSARKKEREELIDRHPAEMCLCGCEEEREEGLPACKGNPRETEGAEEGYG